MNGSVGADFKERASKERTERIAKQDRLEEIRQLRAKAQRHSALSMSDPDPGIRAYHDCAAKGYLGTASFLEALNNKIIARNSEA